MSAGQEKQNAYNLGHPNIQLLSPTQETALASFSAKPTPTIAPLVINTTNCTNGIYQVHTNHLDIPTQLTDATQKIVWQANYQTFGNATINQDPDANGKSIVYNQRFPGQYQDVETNLYYNFYRDYDPSTGRYLQSDPIGLGGGINLYSYVGGNPLSRIDAFGLATGIPDPNGVVPGGPWKPAGPGQLPGDFYGPPKPGGGGRDMCRFVPDENNNGPDNAEDPYWKIKSPKSPWQRYDLNGKPISPNEAHPREGQPDSSRPNFPNIPGLGRVGVGLGLILHSDSAY